MKTFLIRTLCLVAFVSTLAAAQEVIPLYPGTPPGSTPETYPEKEYFSQTWNTEVVANVTKPTLTVFKPSPELKNGTAVVICPGGGFMALSIASEGTDVAKYLAARGVTAFVLKYRLAHTGDDATQEFTDLYADRQKFHDTMGKVIPLAVADGLAAVTYVRQHAAEWGVSPDRVGIIGFSAGGSSHGRGCLSLLAGRPARLRRSDLCRRGIEGCSRSSGRAADVRRRCDRRFTRTRAAQYCLVREVDGRSQIGRTAHVRQGRPRFRHAQAQPPHRSLDRPVRRVAGVRRVSEEVTSSDSPPGALCFFAGFR